MTVTTTLLLLDALAAKWRGKIDDYLQTHTARIEKLIGTAHSVPWLKRALTLRAGLFGLIASLVALATVADKPVFSIFGLNDVLTTLVAMGVNLVIAAMGDLGVGARAYELSRLDEAERWGAEWIAKVIVIVASTVIGLGTITAVAWIRAKDFASDANALFGVRSPGFAAGFALFAAISAALFTTALILGWRRAESADTLQEEAVTTPPPRKARRVAAQCRRTLHGACALQHRGEAAINRQAARLQARVGDVPEKLPEISLPAEPLAFIRATLAAYEQ